MTKRPRIVEFIGEGIVSGRWMTLVSAPAGFGKTTCICECVQSTDEFIVTWLSLDDSDDDPNRFFAYFAASLASADVTFGTDIVNAMSSGRLPDCGMITTALANDLLDSERNLVIVLDDFQVIQDDFLLCVVESLIRKIAGYHHFIIGTREDPSFPLAMLRANNQLTEIRAGDLCFRGDETEQFVERISGVSLSHADLALLEERTEGWVAGLQLAALSLQGRPNHTRLIAELSGSRRNIIAYLTEQVLDTQTSEIRSFLLQTSFLDELCGDLCDHITGRTDSALLLETLSRANLFLLPADDTGLWYRYHRLFSDLLGNVYRRTAQVQEINEVRIRAAHWFGNRGMVLEAIEHAVRATDFEFAVDLLESHAGTLVMQGYARTVHNWIEALPREWGAKSPQTSMALAWMHLLRGAYSRANTYLERLAGVLREYRSTGNQDAQANELLGEWSVARSLFCYMNGEYAESIELATDAFELLETDDGYIRSLAYFSIASARGALHDFNGAVDAYQHAIRFGNSAGNSVAEMMAIAGLSALALERGRLRLAADISSEARDRIETEGVPQPIHAVVYGALADTYFQRYRLTDARNHSLRALQLSERGGYKSGIVFCHILLSRIQFLEGDADSAEREIRAAAEIAGAEIPEYVGHELAAQQVRVYLGKSRISSAQMTLQRYGFNIDRDFIHPDLPDNAYIQPSHGILFCCGLNVWIALAKANNDIAGLKAVLPLIETLIQRAIAGDLATVEIEALLIRAQILSLIDDTASTDRDRIRDIRRALEVASGEGFIGILAEYRHGIMADVIRMVRHGDISEVARDFARRVIVAFSSEDTAELHDRGLSGCDDPDSGYPASPVFEALSARELEVLALLVEGLKYDEVADRLFVSINTIRSHVKTIYGKLHANNRTQAIETARRLKLL